MAKKKKDTDVQANNSFSWDDLSESGMFSLLDDIEPISGYIDTGNLAMNYICSGKFIGGGIPQGRITEIFGNSATGKSLIGMNVMKATQTLDGVPILLDAEQAVSKDFAMIASKINPKRLIVTTSDTLEGCFNKIYSSIKNLRERVPIHIPIVILYDSIAASPSEREYAETKLDMENATKTQIKEAGAGLVDQPGERAKVCSKHFRNLPNFLKEHNATLVVINQVREKIGVMFGDNQTTAGGGRALEFYATLRLKLRAKSSPKDKKGNIMGVNIGVKNVKNRCFRPFVETENVHLFFEKGINPFSGLLSLLLNSDRVSSPSAGNFVVAPEWTEDGQEFKFKSSLDRNDVPVEVLLQCPKLVDATSPEEIMYYVSLCDTAINASLKEIDSEDAIVNIAEGDF